MLSYKNTILCCLCLVGLTLLSQCKSKEEPSPDVTCHIGEFDMFETKKDVNDHPIYGEQDIYMKCRWNQDGTIVRNTAGIEDRGTWSVVDDSLLVVRIDSLYETKGSYVFESPAYDTSVIQQCNDHHLILTSSSNGYTSTITWVRRPE